MTDRSEPMSSPAHWQSRPEAGTTAGIRFLMLLARTLGRNTLRIALYPVAAYFFVVRAPERRASREFLARVHGRPARAREVFRHFLSFARVAADRFFFFAGQDSEVPVQFVGTEAVQAIVDSGKTGIFLAAHFGSFEAARVIGPQIGGIQLKIVLDERVSGRFLQLMTELNPQLAESIIDSGQDAVQLGLTIKDALRNKHWVGFLADRHRTGDRVLRTPFLDGLAEFPVGPYIIANSLKAPIICMFCRPVGAGYVVHCEVLTERANLPRENRQEALTALVGNYAERLEQHVRAAPYGWFNFFDFWEAERTIDPADKST